jgi:hypothetical protein
MLLALLLLAEERIVRPGSAAALGFVGVITVLAPGRVGSGNCSGNWRAWPRVRRTVCR